MTPKCITITRPKARKRHVCCECGAAIEPGTVYVRTSGVWDDPASFAQCVPCAEVMRAAMETLPDWYDPEEHAPAYGDLREHLRGLEVADLAAVAGRCGNAAHVVNLRAPGKVAP